MPTFDTNNSVVTQDLVPGVYGGPLQIPSLTLNANGQIISAQNIPMAPVVDQAVSQSVASADNSALGFLALWPDGRVLTDSHGRIMPWSNSRF